MSLRVSSTCAHHQEVKIALHSLWYHHTYRCASSWLITEINILRCTVRKTSKNWCKNVSDCRHEAAINVGQQTTVMSDSIPDITCYMSVGLSFGESKVLSAIQHLRSLM